MLNAFLNKVDAREKNGQLTEEQADALREEALGIQLALDCPGVSNTSTSSPSSTTPDRFIRENEVDSMPEQTELEDFDPPSTP